MPWSISYTFTIILSSDHCNFCLEYFNTLINNPHNTEVERSGSYFRLNSKPQSI